MVKEIKMGNPEELKDYGKLYHNNMTTGHADCGCKVVLSQFPKSDDDPSIFRWVKLCDAHSKKEPELKPVLSLYQSAINQIDDYFEYRYINNSHNEIKSFVMGVIDNITKGIKKINCK